MAVLDGPPATLFVVPLTSDEVRLPVDGRVCAYRSTNYGDTWAACGAGLPPHNYGTVLRDALTSGEWRIHVALLWYHQRRALRYLGHWRTLESLPGVFPRILSVRAITAA